MKMRKCLILGLIIAFCMPVSSLAMETDVTAYVRPRGRLVVEIIRMPGLADIILPDEETWGRAVLTSGDMDCLEEGTDITVQVTAAPAETPGQFKQFEVRGYHALYSTDISIIKKVGDNVRNMEETSVLLALNFEVPGLSGREYGVIRYHGTDVAVMESNRNIQGYTGIDNSLFSVFTVYERIQSESIQTGDYGRQVPYILLCIAAVIVALYLSVRQL